MKKLIFDLNDFAETLWDGRPVTMDRIAKIAQAKHDAWLTDVMKDAVVLYSNPDKNIDWSKEKMKYDTHQALLIDIRQIEKKCQRHEPTLTRNSDGYAEKYICKHCGVKLVAEWKEKK